MASEASFTDFGDSFIDTVASDLYAVSTLSVSLSVLVLRIQGLRLPCDRNFSALEDEALFHDVFGLSLSTQVPPFPTGEYFPTSQEMPPDTLSTPGVSQSPFYPLQASHEASILQSRTIVAPSDNIVREIVLCLRRVYGVKCVRFHSSPQLHTMK